MGATELRLTISRATVDEIKASPDLATLLAEYAAESANTGIGPASPQLDSYRKMEESGFLRAFAARVDGQLIGFMFMLLSVLPHFGRKVGVAESYFVAAEHRKSGAGLRLLRAAEEVAQMEGAVGLLLSAPTGGVLERVAPGVGYRETNRVFFKALQ
jgi:GNAT superfamily N-acetyltransferase